MESYKCTEILRIREHHVFNSLNSYCASLIKRSNGQQHTVKIPTDQKRAPMINSLSIKSEINPGVTPGRVKYRYFKIVIAGVIMMQAYKNPANKDVVARIMKTSHCSARLHRKNDEIAFHKVVKHIATMRRNKELELGPRNVSR